MANCNNRYCFCSKETVVLTAVFIAMLNNLIGFFKGDGLYFLCRTKGGFKLTRNTHFSSLKF